jgi:hypothetical protein
MNSSHSSAMIVPHGSLASVPAAPSSDAANEALVAVARVVGVPTLAPARSQFLQAIGERNRASSVKAQP